MKKLVTFASDVRLNALLCSSVAVLLTACGGTNIDGTNGQQTQTAAYTYNSASSASGAMDATASSADADTSTTPAVADQAGQSANPGLDMSGYGAGELGAASGATENTPAASGQAEGNAPTG
jgi:hypothetical protein